MSFEAGRRRGRYWEDVQKLDKLIRNHNFNITSKSEKDFENSFSSVLMNRKEDFSSKIITQIDKEVIVQSVYCFGKNHRPDLTLDKDGIAVEIKYINETTDGAKHAIGQAYFYRLRYRFAVIVLVLSQKNKALYEKIINGEEKDLEDIVKQLADELNIFCYIMPAFSLKPNIKGHFAAFEFIADTPQGS